VLIENAGKRFSVNWVSKTVDVKDWDTILLLRNEKCDMGV
jgi:hypothetical protein